MFDSKRSAALQLLKARPWSASAQPLALLLAGRLDRVAIACLLARFWFNARARAETYRQHNAALLAKTFSKVAAETAADYLNLSPAEATSARACARRRAARRV